MQPGEVVVAIAGMALGIDPAAEVAGTVVEAGEAARQWLGKRVVVPRVLPCGDCAICRRGRVAACPACAPRNGREEREVVPARFLCSVEPPLWPAGLADEDLWRLAALADAAAAPFGALMRAGIGPGDGVSVAGEGPRAAFARAIVVAKGAQLVEENAQVVLDCGGGNLWERLAPGGTLVLLDRSDVTWWSLTAPRSSEVTILVGSACHPDLYPELCALAARGELPLVELTRTVTVTDWPSEIDAPRDPRPELLHVLRRR